MIIFLAILLYCGFLTLCLVACLFTFNKPWIIFTVWFVICFIGTIPLLSFISKDCSAFKEWVKPYCEMQQKVVKL